MSHRIVVKSFADLALVLNLEDLPAGPPVEASAPPPTSPVSNEEPPDLVRLLADLETASATLVDLARRDQEQHTAALRDLEQYDALVANQREAEQARDQAQRVRGQAEALAETGFTDEARATAGHVAESAHQAETAAARLAEQRRVEAEQLAARLDLERLLTERRRQAEAEHARQREAERARRISETVSRARGALEAGRLAEARAALEGVVHDAGDAPEVKELARRIAQREFAAKVALVENALWAARREYRREPAVAIAHLTALEMAGLPADLSRQVFGAWVRACTRLCHAQGLLDPLRYAPDPGQGAVIAREAPNGEYIVVSVLGLGAGWQVGEPVGEGVVRRARPLH
ncbi:MAG: hypothetical protein KIT87_24420 [Anaerolineae bacterium]|nr:hypothetical protein [Anaerolineae bacterium]